MTPMTRKETKNLENGLYRLHWKAGEYSLASVGRCADGTTWFAPANWVRSASKVAGDIGSTNWRMVSHAIRLHDETGTRSDV